MAIQKYTLQMTLCHVDLATDLATGRAGASSLND